MRANASVAPRTGLLAGLLLLYAAASLLHFSHNAEYLGDYPNLPSWLTRAGVYSAWLAQTAVGIFGYAIFRRCRRPAGLILLAAYAGFGFDGLLHYTRAPFAVHTAAMNFTIVFEVATATILLACILAQALPPVRRCELPETALLRRYLVGGSYADCYVMDVPRPVSRGEFIAAFYTTVVFKLERLILSRLAARPSTDAEVEALASGTLDSFAAWNVEDRAGDQLLLTDFRGRTRSWLMVEAIDMKGTRGTRLYFGSAVVPAVDRVSGQPTLGLGFRALLGFHKLYSRVLLRAARSRLMRMRVR